MTSSQPNVPYFQAWFARTTFIRAIKVSAIVGTILILINQGDLIASGAAPPLWKVLLTYTVPYAVSSWSSVAAQRQNRDLGQQSSSSAQP